MAKLFKDYIQGQTMLFPPSLEDMVGATHPVRVVNSVLDRLDLDRLFKQYHVRGASSYHPRMLLKVLVFGYVSNI